MKALIFQQKDKASFCMTLQIKIVN